MNQPNYKQKSDALSIENVQQVVNTHYPALLPTVEANSQGPSGLLPKVQRSRLADYVVEASITPLNEGVIPGTETRWPGSKHGWVEIERRSSQYPLTQAGNAERLIERFGEDLRYCHTWAKWLLWDGRRWMPDNKERVEILALQTVRYICKEAGVEDDGDRHRALLSHAKRSEKAAELAALMTLAQSMPRIAVTSAEFDQDPYLLNCQNGTVDLRTGVLLKHDRKHLLTKLCPVDYIEDYECPRWLRFLEEVFGRDKELIAFMQRVLGCALTGVPEEGIFFFVGKGANGKTTLLETLRNIMGDYARATDINLLMQKATNNDQLYATAALEGRRFVTASETKEGEALNEARVKLLTGRQRIPARHPYGGPFEFAPQFKFFVDFNHRPVIRGTDYGIWRRIHEIPFKVTFKEDQKDPDLPNKLREEAPGILAWAVEGCKVWQEHGLAKPKAVQEAGEEYRQEMDVLAEFIDECCTVDPTAQALSGDLYTRFVQWCRGRGQWKPLLSSKGFGTNLEEKGFPKKHTRGGSMRQGIRLRPGGENVSL